MTDELKTERVLTLMTKPEVEAIDDWSFQRRIRSRGEAVRQLVAMALKASSEPAKKPKRSG